LPPGKCVDNGAQRDIVVPQLGDLIITEVMADPAAVADAAGEWFEVAVARDVDLNGVEIGTTPGTPLVVLGGDACRRRTMGTYLVFAHTTDGGMNGGLTAVEDTFAFGLANGGGSLYIGADGNVLDQMTYTAAATGASRAVDPTHVSAAQNDDVGNWCDATSTYGVGDKGTPGAPNDPCPLPAGKCLGGGAPRDIVAPQLADPGSTQCM